MFCQNVINMRPENVCNGVFFVLIFENIQFLDSQPHRIIIHYEHRSPKHLRVNNKMKTAL